MKKGLLLAMGVSAAFSLAAQAPKVGGVKKVDLRQERTITLDGSNANFFANANAAQRTINPNAPLTQGTKFSSSYNAFTLLVSQSNCLTANQALNVALFTHRLSQDWSPDANTASGYGEYSWTTDCGTTWDSAYYADNTVLGNQRFRYPSGGLINPPANTTLANAYMVATGPWTDGAGWGGWYTTYQTIANASTATTAVNTPGPLMAFPRIDMQSCTNNTIHVTGGHYATPTGATPAGYDGAVILTGTLAGSVVTYTYDSIMPSFHVAPTSGATDNFEVAHLAYSPDGMTGYCVFFGVDAAATTPTTRTFSPIAYKTIDAGVTWTAIPMFDFTTIPVIMNHLIPATGGSYKPWFDQSQGSDVVVDNNGQLHILCTIGSGASDDNDSLGYTWTLTGQSGTTARHYIFDTYTTASGWNSWLVDSLMTTTSTNTTIFVDGSNSGAAFPTDARIQISSNTSRDHLFYMWVDSDPLALQGENALPDLYGKAVDLTTGNWTAKKQFTATQDFYFHFVSNVTLTSGVDFHVPVTNSIDRSGGHDVATTFDHYYLCGVDFLSTDFVGIAENSAAFGSFKTYPNPANDQVNISLNLIKSGDVTITLTNALGQIVSVENRTMASGENNVQLNTTSLQSGIYFVNVAANGSSSTSKVVKQ
ncbi:MAG: T9SS type A sorting domain-containing protein [Bacteroidetes bacterium]|nr:T9SS type A sorting domain-containing protein [Bacteroidota bacterium]